MRMAEMEARERIIAFITRTYRRGLTTTSGGNFSVLQEDGTIAITPSGIDKGGLSPGDIMMVGPDGEIWGKHKPSVELPIHKGIYNARPEIRAIVHAHPPAMVALSLIRRMPYLRSMPFISSLAGNLHIAAYATPGSPDLGANIAAEFARGADAVIMENHGLICGGSDMKQAYARLEAAEHLAQLEIDAAGFAEQRPAPIESEGASGGSALQAPSAPWSQSEELLRFSVRAYNQKLFGAAFGTLSKRFEEGFIILRPEADRADCEELDAVYIGSGGDYMLWPEAEIHRAVYAAHPEVGAIASGSPRALSVFLAGGVGLASRTIPESYIMLRDVARQSFDAAFCAGAVAEAITASTPVVQVDNYAFFTTGETLVKAFDRFEVAEASALSLINARALGEIALISDDEIADIERNFMI